MTDLDAGRPHESSRADVTLVTRGLTVTAAVDISTESTIVVRPDGEGAAWRTSVKDGDPVELYWVSAHEERTLPARVIDVEPGDEVRWHLAATGPAERSQAGRPCGGASPCRCTCRGPTASWSARPSTSATRVRAE